jgi:hypothetical protein
MKKKEFISKVSADNFIPYTIFENRILWNDPYRFPDTESSFRPKCINHGCVNPVAIMRGTLGILQGREIRSVCSHCHQASYGKKLLKQGVTSIKKTFCENHDSHLGFDCKSIIHSSANLQLDHIDGNHFNNIPSNIQTLCSICHTEKSIRNGDFKLSLEEQEMRAHPSLNNVLPDLYSNYLSKTDPMQQPSSPCIEEFVQPENQNMQDI